MDSSKKPAIDYTEYSKESFLLYGKWPSRRWDYSHHVVPPITASTNFSFSSVGAGSKAFADYVSRREGVDQDEYDYI
jgi:methionine-gamma-lyase